QALTIALQGFKGAVVLVSHDRELIANVCDELFLVHDGQIDEFDGDISDYGKWLAEKRKQENASDKNTGKKKNKKDDKKSVTRETDTDSANSQMTKPSISKSDQINNKATTTTENKKTTQ